jgi:hypothetical protein
MQKSRSKNRSIKDLCIYICPYASIEIILKDITFLSQTVKHMPVCIRSSPKLSDLRLNLNIFFVA